jgi:anti-sigma B factor antagonist
MNPDALLGIETAPVRVEIIVFPSEVDISNAEYLGASLLAAIRPGVSMIIADMTTTYFCDSSGIRQLAIAHSRAKESLAQLRVVTTRVPVLRILHLTGLDQVLDIRPSLDGALANSGLEGAGAIGC